MTSLLPNQSEQQFITNSINEALELYGSIQEKIIHYILIIIILIMGLL